MKKLLIKKSLKFFLTLATIATGLGSTAQKMEDNNYVVQLDNKNIVLKSGETTIATLPNTNNVKPIIVGNKLYFILNTKNEVEATSKLMCYSISETSQTDISSKFSFTNEKLTKNEIVRLVLDKKNEKLFLSIKLGEEGKIENFQTLKFDIASGKLQEYKDGIISEIGIDNNQTFIFLGTDSKGAYKKTYSYTENGELIKTSEKDYF